MADNAIEECHHWGCSRGSIGGVWSATSLRIHVNENSSVQNQLHSHKPINARIQKPLDSDYSVPCITPLLLATIGITVVLILFFVKMLHLLRYGHLCCPTMQQWFTQQFSGCREPIHIINQKSTPASDRTTWSRATLCSVENDFRTNGFLPRCRKRQRFATVDPSS